MNNNKILVLITMLIVPSLLFSGTLFDEFTKSIASLLKVLWLLGKIAGFAILMWAIGELIQADKGQSADYGGKFLSFFIKIFISSLFVGAEKIFDIVMKYS